jgi:putative endonuclease
MTKRFHNYYVYLLTNKHNTVLYTGVTNDLERRIYEHKHRIFEGFTKQYNLTKVVYYEYFEHIEQAIARDKEIKGWKRSRKNTLVESMNPDWNDLSEEWE